MSNKVLSILLYTVDLKLTRIDNLHCIFNEKEAKMRRELGEDKEDTKVSDKKQSLSEINYSQKCKVHTDI